MNSSRHFQTFFLSSLSFLLLPPPPQISAKPTPFLEKTNHFHCVQIKSTGHPRQSPLGVGGIRPSAESLITPPQPPRPHGLRVFDLPFEVRRFGCCSLPKTLGVQTPRRPRALGPSEFDFSKSECAKTKIRARALHRAGLRACATTPWPAIPRDTGATLWFPQLPGVKRKLLEFQERERTESGDGWLEGWERREGRVPRGHLTSISGRRPQHPVSGPRREAAETRGPRLGSRGWEIYS